MIVGGGFGGLAAAQKLRHADVDVTLVDRTNHHLFQPLLYQLAAGAISPGECASSLRITLRHSPNVKVVMGEVTDVDPERRHVVVDGGEHLAYDSLLVACGAETSYFGHDEWRDVTCGLKTLADAVALRDRIYGAFEQAERADDPATQAAWLTFVVVGGGATGVEVSGALAMLAQHIRKHTFRRIDPGNARVILLDARDRVVPAFSEKLSAKAARYLGELGVEVRGGARATAIDSEGVTIEAGGSTERVAARTVIWAAGVRAAGLSAKLAAATGVGTDRAGRIEVCPDLTLPGHPGDLRDRRRDEPGGARRPAAARPGDSCDPAGASRRQGDPRRQARSIHAVPLPRQGRPGRRRAGQGGLRGKGALKLSGRPAFAIYLGVHLYYLGGGIGRRVAAADELDLCSDRPPSERVDRGRARAHAQVRGRRRGMT